MKSKVATKKNNEEQFFGFLLLQYIPLIKVFEQEQIPNFFKEVKF